MPTVLIPTIANDIHAMAVDYSLKRRGNKVYSWFGADFPTKQTQTVSISSNECAQAIVEGIDADLLSNSVDVVWNRRRASPFIPADCLHEDDEPLAIAELRAFETAFVQNLADTGIWVNAERAIQTIDPKIAQLRLAQSLGVRVPDTIFTNDPTRIKSFLNRHDHTGAIYKPFRPMGWFDGAQTRMGYTAPVNVGALPGDSVLQLVPGIYQERIRKSFEYRITCFGRYQVALKIDSQASAVAQEDWRADAIHSLVTEVVPLPGELAEFCYKYMRSAGLIFCVFDFIVSEGGDLVFLESNQAGQFLFVEELHPDVPLLASFTEFIEMPTIEFEPTMTAPTTSFASFLGDNSIRSAYRAEAGKHLRNDPLWVAKRMATAVP